jgi:hypothetical protein
MKFRKRPQDIQAKASRNIPAFIAKPCPIPVSRRQQKTRTKLARVSDFVSA